MRELVTSALLSAAAVSVSPQEAAADAFLLDLQAALDQRVAANGGYGGGVMRVQLGESGVVSQDESGVVVQDGSGILWQGASGWAENIGPSPITTLDTFEIASITKTFTATVILQMHEDSASPVKLSTPIGTLLPASVVENLLVVGGIDYGPEIQVGELLQRVSGLPDYWSSPDFIQAFDADPSRVWYPDELVAYAKAMTPIGIPSAAWHYADTNYVLLGMIVEAVTGQPLEEVFRQRILGPLGMSETYLAYQEPAASLRQESHRFEYTEDLYAQPRQSADWAGGGLVSSNADLQKFLRGLFQGRLFERSKTLGLMKTWTDTGAPGVTYGLGLFRVNLGADRGQLWGHDGWGNAFMYFWPEQDIGFTGTLNQVDNDWYPLVEEAIAQWLLISGPGNDPRVPGAVDATFRSGPAYRMVWRRLPYRRRWRCPSK